MKLKYNFELQPIAGTYVAVATGKGSENFHGVIKLNESGAKIFSFIQDGLDDQQILDEMLKIYGEDAKDDIVADISYINKMIIENKISEE